MLVYGYNSEDLIVLDVLDRKRLACDSQLL